MVFLDACYAGNIKGPAPDPSRVVAVFRQDTRIELDRSRLFNTDQSELRAIMRADLIVPTPLAVVRISKFV